MTDDGKVVGFKPRVVPKEPKPSDDERKERAQQLLTLAEMVMNGNITSYAIACVHVDGEGKSIMTGYDMPTDWALLLSALTVLQREVLDRVED